MSDESRILVLTVENERLHQENDRLRAENAGLRPLISEYRWRLRLEERPPAEPQPTTDQHTRTAREHA